MKKAKPFALTLKSYFDPKRPHVSASMVEDYLENADYYYRKHVEKSLPRKAPTPAMIVGSFVDATLTNPSEAKLYRRKVLAKDDKDLYAQQKAMDPRYLLSDADLEKGLAIAQFVASQPCWKDGLKDAIMQLPMEGELFGMKICGLADRLQWNEDKTKLHIIDLKCTSSQKVASPRKWLWNAVEMGYVRQFAMYRLLACMTFGIERDSVYCSHIAACHRDGGYVTVDLYAFPKHLVDQAEAEILAALQKIANKEFPKPCVEWDDAIDVSLWSPEEASD